MPETAYVNGEFMALSEAKVSVEDRGYRDAFDGLAFLNRGGHYVLKQMTVFGTP